MLRNAFYSVYTKFKLHFYKEIFQRFQIREASLTMVERFCEEDRKKLEEMLWIISRELMPEVNLAKLHCPGAEGNSAEAQE